MCRSKTESGRRCGSENKHLETLKRRARYHEQKRREAVSLLDVAKAEKHEKKALATSKEVAKIIASETSVELNEGEEFTPQTEPIEVKNENGENVLTIKTNENGFIEDILPDENLFNLPSEEAENILSAALFETLQNHARNGYMVPPKRGGSTKENVISDMIQGFIEEIFGKHDNRLNIKNGGSSMAGRQRGLAALGVTNQKLRERIARDNALRLQQEYEEFQLAQREAFLAEQAASDADHERAIEA